MPKQSRKKKGGNPKDLTVQDSENIERTKEQKGGNELENDSQNELQNELEKELINSLLFKISST